jgi:hypothetical protein
MPAQGVAQGVGGQGQGISLLNDRLSFLLFPRRCVFAGINSGNYEEKDQKKWYGRMFFHDRTVFIYDLLVFSLKICKKTTTANCPGFPFLSGAGRWQGSSKLEARCLMLEG